MRKFLIAAVIGMAAGYVLIRLSQRRPLSEELSGDELEESLRPAAP